MKHLISEKDMNICEERKLEAVTFLFALKPLRLLKLAFCISFQINLRENALQSGITETTEMNSSEEKSSHELNILADDQLKTIRVMPK